MNREITSTIRYLMDEWVPPAIRDSRFFMWPFYVLAYGTFDVKRFMEFKSRVYNMTSAEYAEFYGSLNNSVSRRRKTDLNEASIQELISAIPANGPQSLLDVGAGNGYLLGRLSENRQWRRIAGVDVAPQKTNLGGIEIFSGALPNLPFEDGEFDIVTCTHVLEHVIDLQSAIHELLRITKMRLLVVLPRQRDFYFTLDEHVNFFPRIEPLANMFKPMKVDVSLKDGDWVLIIDVQSGRIN